MLTPPHPVCVLPTGPRSAFTLAPALASSFTTVDIHLSAHVNINDVSMPGLFAAALAACAFFAAFFFREAPGTLATVPLSSRLGLVG